MEYVALSADVAPTSQLSLFGGAPAVAPVPAPLAPVAMPAFASALPDAAAAPPPGPSAYQRRSILRDKRHRLVGDLGRREGRSHREINAWLNQAVGVARVEDATLEQLQRAIDLLLDALSAGAGRGGTARRPIPARGR
jgi:hypothetical protein